MPQIIHVEPPVARFAVAGPVLSLADFYGLLDRMVGHPGFDRCGGVIHDVRELQGVPPTSCMDAMVDYFRTRADKVGGRRWAMVVAEQGSAMYGLGRMAEMLSDNSPVEFRVFADLSAAAAWASKE